MSSKLAARLVDGDAAAHQNGQSVLRLEAEELGLAAEEHDRKLRLARDNPHASAQRFLSGGRQSAAYPFED